MSELLSISIPTRNRATYLQELLNSIEEQVKLGNEVLNDIKIYIFDNASTDHTADVIKNSNLDIKYQRNNENTGVDANLFQAYTATPGKYVWVIGDDELSGPNMLNIVLQLIKSYQPHLIINRNDGWYKLLRVFNAPAFTESWVFPSYRDFAVECLKSAPRLLIAHSLISLNVVLKCCFDAEFAKEKIDTNYGHFYGMVKGLKTFSGPVLFTPQETIIVRKQRADRVDGIQVINLLGKHQAYLDWFIKEYFVNDYRL